MKIAISAETTCDLLKEQIEENDIKIIPFTIILGEEVINDGADAVDKIFDYYKKTKSLPKTSALNEIDYTNHFESLLKDYDSVIHISLSSGLSSSYSHAMLSAEKLQNVYVIDSQTLSTGIGLLVLYAKTLADKGLSPKEIVELVEKRKSAVQASFVIDKLDFLHKGGRCNALALFGANLLKIHPQIIVSEGTMKPAKKYRGKMEKVVSNYCLDVLSEFNNADKSIGFVTHTTATTEMVENAKKALQDAGFEKIYETVAGGTITAHCGENVLGILYFNDGGKN